MGGSDSRYYRHFRTYCCEAYNILRKSATLILSLFHLMAGAAIPDVRQDPEKAMLKLQVCLSYHIANPSHQRPFSCSLLCWPQVLGRSCSSCRFALHVAFNPSHLIPPPPTPAPNCCYLTLCFAQLASRPAQAMLKLQLPCLLQLAVLMTDILF